jgi:hypothetical protein
LTEVWKGLSSCWSSRWNWQGLRWSRRTGMLIVSAMPYLVAPQFRVPYEIDPDSHRIAKRACRQPRRRLCAKREIEKLSVGAGPNDDTVLNCEWLVPALHLAAAQARAGLILMTAPPARCAVLFVSSSNLQPLQRASRIHLT